LTGKHLQVRVNGKMSMYFYDIEAGSKILNSTRIPPRSSPHMLNAVVDASNLPTGTAIAQPSGIISAFG